MESIYSSSTHFTRVDGTIRPYRYFSNLDDKVVMLGPREVECGTVKQPGVSSSELERRDDQLDRSR
jgi:hypothetical protein